MGLFNGFLVPLFKRGNVNIVSIFLGDNELTCLWAKKSRKNIAESEKLSIKAYEKFDLGEFAVVNGVIFDFIKIRKIVISFISKNGIRNPKISLSIDGSNIFEKIITSQNSFLVEADLNELVFEEKELGLRVNYLGHGSFESSESIFVSRRGLKLNYLYLCPKILDNDQIYSGFDFYVCAIPNEIVFQYRLLISGFGAEIINFTTKFMAILECYKKVKGDGFSQSQLGLDLASKNYLISGMLTRFDLEKIINKESYKFFENINLDKDLTGILSCIGLFWLGEKAWKK